jgi:cobalamin biosynthesis Mg chelatase CobN
VAVLGRRGAIALTCAAALVMPAAALANAYDDTLKEYRTTGAINGCGYTAAKLAQAKAQTPKNIKDVAPGYPAQLAVAAAKQAKGCTKAEEKAASTAAAAATGTTGTGSTGAGSTGTGAGTTAPGATTATQPPATTTIAPNATTTAATPAPVPAPAAATQTAAQSTSSHKGARLALIVFGALLVMLLALWAFARWWAWEPHWLARWRHATAEAGWRASAAWAEFTDWLRLGR